MGSRQPQQAAHSCKCSRRLHIFSSPMILLSLILPTTSFAQLASTSSVGATGATGSGAAATASSTSPTFLTTTMNSLAASALSHTSTFSTLTSSQSHAATDSGLAAAGSGSSDDDDDPGTMRSTSLLNYYFVFLAIFGIFLFVGFWYIHRRKKRMKARFRNSGQNALARDLNGWTTSRRWIHGNWRTGHGGHVHRREEGLNELGEAPPPYKARVIDTPVVAASEGQAWTEQGSSSEPTLAVPLEVFSREGRATLKPPDYYAETVRSVNVAGSEDQQISIPQAAARPDSRPLSKPTAATPSTT